METKQPSFKSRQKYINCSVINNVIAIAISNLLINFHGVQVFIYFPLDFNFQHLLESLQEQLQKTIFFKRSIRFCFPLAILIHTINNISSIRSSYQRRSVKKVFLKISQNSQENTCVRVSSVFEMQSILESRDLTGHTHFWPYPPNRFLISF